MFNLNNGVGDQWKKLWNAPSSRKYPSNVKWEQKGYVKFHKIKWHEGLKHQNPNYFL